MKNLRGIFLGILIGFAGANFTCATSSDAYIDFSVTNGNPNGLWTYGWSTTLLSTLNLYTNGFADGNGILIWNDPSHISAGAPSVFANPSNTQQGVLPPMSAAFHPGASGEFSQYVWTAPSSGSFSISALFSPFDSGGTDVHILDNGVSLFSAQVSPGNPQSFNGVIVVAAGDIISFAVGVGTDGTYNSDTTGIFATIQSVPEASTWVYLVGAGALMLVVKFRRRAASAAREVH